MKHKTITPVREMDYETFITCIPIEFCKLFNFQIQGTYLELKSRHTHIKLSWESISHIVIHDGSLILLSDYGQVILSDKGNAICTMYNRKSLETFSYE